LAAAISEFQSSSGVILNFSLYGFVVPAGSQDPDAMKGRDEVEYVPACGPASSRTTAL